MLDNRALSLTSFDDTQYASQRLGEVFLYTVDLSPMLEDRSVEPLVIGSAVFTPSDTHQPTVTVSGITDTGFNVLISGVVQAWNGGTGHGTAILPVTINDSGSGYTVEHGYLTLDITLDSAPTQATVPYTPVPDDGVLWVGSTAHAYTLPLQASQERVLTLDMEEWLGGRNAANVALTYAWSPNMGVPPVTLGPASSTQVPINIMNPQLGYTGVLTLKAVAPTTGETKYLDLHVAGPADVSDALLARAALAAASTGFVQLGTQFSDLWGNGDFARETSFLFNPVSAGGDDKYYAFSTNYDGNQPIPFLMTGTTVGANCTVTTNVPHHLIAGQSFGVSNHAGSGAFGLGVFLATSIVDATHFVCNRTGGGNDTGTINPIAKPRITMRRSSTLAGLTTATGSDFVEVVAKDLYFPTVYRTPTNDWHIWGTTIPAPNYTRHQVMTGASPLWVSAGVLLDQSYGDASVALNPLDNMWYMVSNLHDSNNVMQLYKTASLADPQVWTLVRANIFSVQGLPTGSLNFTPDPNIFFIDGNMYLMWVGSTISGQPSVYMVALDYTTGLPTSTPVVLLAYGAWPAWTLPNFASDPIFIRCPDGFDRIFIFANDNNAHDPAIHGKWGCLVLGA